MTVFLVTWAESTWQVLVDSALFFLFGLILAGLVWTFINESNLSRWLGGSRKRQVIRAALIGVPLPLCSCSVLPVATQLRFSGLSRGGTVSFLIATPESSIDSIILTYSLTDPLLTAARPIAAFLTAAVAGFTESVFDGEPEGHASAQQPVPACSCACESEPKTLERSANILVRLLGGLRYSFTTLMGDLAPYLFWGYLLAGLAGAVFGPALGLSAGTGWWPYAVAVVIGVPLYVCATSSTPLAAVLLGAGFPPGAIMVFLMVGPATNLATIMVVKRILGLWPTVRYVAVIVVMALVCGLVLDQLYHVFDISIAYETTGHEHGAGWSQLAAAVTLTALILWHSLRHLTRRRAR